MTNLNPRSWFGSLFGLAVMLVITGLLLQWAWSLLRPMLPLLTILVLGILATRLVLAYRRRW